MPFPLMEQTESRHRVAVFLVPVTKHDKPSEGRGHGCFIGAQVWHTVSASKTSNQEPSSGTCLVAQVVKNLPAMWETWVQFLGQEDTQEKGMTTGKGIPNIGMTHSNILA